jgi:Sugar (and other) transporter
MRRALGRVPMRHGRATCGRSFLGRYFFLRRFIFPHTVEAIPWSIPPYDLTAVRGITCLKGELSSTRRSFNLTQASPPYSSRVFPSTIPHHSSPSTHQIQPYPSSKMADTTPTDKSLEQGHHETTAVPATGNRLAATEDIDRIEAPVTWQAYLICAFASFGGIFFGYDSGYINGTTGSALFIHIVEGPDAKALTSPHSSAIVSILSAGTFIGALIAGDVAERIGRKWTVIIGCLIYIFGVVIQMITGPEVNALATIIAGRIIAGIGVGFESAIVILYMSEIVSFGLALLFLWLHQEYFFCLSYITNKFLSSVRSPSVVPLSQATNSASLSVLCLLRSLCMLPRSATTQARTAFPLLFSKPWILLIHIKHGINV